MTRRPALPPESRRPRSSGRRRLALWAAAGLLAGDPSAAYADSARLVPGKPVVVTAKWQGTAPKQGLGLLASPGPPVLVTVKVGTLHNPNAIGLGLRLFLNRPDATSKTPDSAPGYLGSFAFFPVNPGPGVPAGSFVVDLRTVLQNLPISALRGIIAGTPKITAILVPLVEGEPERGIDAEVTSVEIEIRPAD
jgi:hypothetical protein